MIRKVQVIVYRPDSDRSVLLLRRGPKRGHIWQPVTGKIDPEDANPRQAALRELREETGIEQIRTFWDTDTAFRFTKGASPCVEHLFGVEVEPTTAVTLSSEHVAYGWFDPSEAAERMRWETNRDGLARVLDVIKAGTAGTEASPPDEPSKP